MKVKTKISHFICKAVENGKIIDFYSKNRFENKWNLLLFYPLNFTFVCPTELLELSNRVGDFEKRQCNLFGISVDSEFSHRKWIELPKKQGGLGGKINFTLLSDLNRNISKMFKTLNINKTFSDRWAFIIDPKSTIRHICCYDSSIGRNIDEFLRILDALQFSDENGLVCPAGWVKGDSGLEV